jgi:hypothetical protein
VIKYAEGILTVFKPIYGADLLDFSTLGVEVVPYSFSSGQADSVSCFTFAISELKHMTEAVYQNKIEMGDHPIYLKHTQSIKSLNSVKEQLRDLEVNPGLKISDIIDNAVIVVQEGEEGDFKAKAMNFSIYNSAHKMYSKTQEILESLSDEKVVDMLLQHDPVQILGFAPVRESFDMSTTLAGEVTENMEFSGV